MPANVSDGRTPEERARRDRLIGMIKALARLVNHDGIISATEEPARGTYAGDVPFNEQTRTVTFEVRDDLYDDAHMPQGVNNRLIERG